MIKETRPGPRQRAAAGLGTRGKRAAPPAANHRAAKKIPTPAPKRFTLYGVHRSGPTYKVALMLRLAGEPFSYVHVDLRGGEQKTPAYLAKNRYGQVPCLVDGKLCLCQSAAILEHLAEALGRFQPRGVEARARMREWLFWDFDRLAAIYRSRAFLLGTRQAAPEVVAHYRRAAQEALTQLERMVPDEGFLVGARASIADIDLYGVVRYAPEAALSLDALPKVKAWAKRVEALPRFAPPEDILPQESRA